ncbi:MAG: hypothetical protein OXE57_10360 [Alphaproteobacteria bacterium]|nr:hypothetical protein [Alphaproteobacteria bacterium]
MMTVTQKAEIARHREMMIGYLKEVATIESFDRLTDVQRTRRTVARDKAASHSKMIDDIRAAAA